VQIRVYYEDTDCGNMVYHSNYLNFCERARSELFFRKNLLPHSNNEFFVVKECSANWIKSAKFADILDIKTTLLQKRAASIIMKQEIYRENELIFEAEFKLAFLKFGVPAKIPADIFEILEN
jgi:acyl-CoA thioester hydrolase